MQSTYLQSDIARSTPIPITLSRTPILGINLSEQSGETVYLIANDQSVRKALSELIESQGLKIVSFSSADEYLSCAPSSKLSCLIIDLHLPDCSGLDLQRKLAGKDSPPIIFVSGNADIASSVQAMKAGAIEFLVKPINPEELRLSIQTALARDRKLKARRADLDDLQRRYRRLTPREREVLVLVVAGLLNKQSASVLGISEITLQVHRRRVVKKMEAPSIAHLVRMALKLHIPEWQNNRRYEPAA